MDQSKKYFFVLSNKKWVVADIRCLKNDTTFKQDFPSFLQPVPSINKLSETFDHKPEIVEHVNDIATKYLPSQNKLNTQSHHANPLAVLPSLALVPVGYKPSFKNRTARKKNSISKKVIHYANLSKHLVGVMPALFTALILFVNNTKDYVLKMIIK